MIIKLLLLLLKFGLETLDQENNLYASSECYYYCRNPCEWKYILKGVLIIMTSIFWVKIHTHTHTTQTKKSKYFLVLGGPNFK